MTIDEAIDDLSKFAEYCQRVNWPTHGKAVKLGIEALKRELEYRESMPPKKGELLPGETEE